MVNQRKPKHRKWTPEITGTIDRDKSNRTVIGPYDHTSLQIHERYGSTYIPLGPVGHNPRLEQAPSARDPFRFPTTRQNRGCEGRVNGGVKGCHSRDRKDGKDRSIDRHTFKSVLIPPTTEAANANAVTAFVDGVAAAGRAACVGRGGRANGGANGGARESATCPVSD